MVLCYERHIGGEFLDSRETVVVLDLGASNINGSYRPIFSGPKFGYVGADLVEGPGVDLVLRDPYKIPLPDASVDVVLSGQMLEHCEFFWLAFVEMCRVVKPDGFLFVIAPSTGDIHRYPVDCYRFLPDAFQALAKYANCVLVEAWRDERGPWRDLVGVFRRAFPLRNLGARADFSNEPFHCDATRPNVPGPAEAERVSEGVDYLEILTSLHARLAPRGYLEVGVRRGHSLALAQCPAVGIDPAAHITQRLGAGTTVSAATSDDYFRNQKSPSFPIDLAFIDGMHAFEYALRDFLNIERRAHPATLIVVDDIFPNHPLQASRIRRTVAWTGDVWKVLPCLRVFRPDLTLVPVDSSPTGLLLIAGLDNKNERLWTHFNEIVKRYLSPEHPDHRRFATPPAEIFERVAALKPDDPRLSTLIALLRAARDEGATKEQMRERLAAWHSSPSFPEPTRT
jgi:hypothetical protein